jgi:hypothetical protein
MHLGKHGTMNGMGGRLFPPATDKNDDKYGHRADQGAFFANGRFGVVVQKNGRPHGSRLASTIVDPKVDTGTDDIDHLITDAKRRKRILVVKTLQKDKFGKCLTINGMILFPHRTQSKYSISHLACTRTARLNFLNCVV